MRFPIYRPPRRDRTSRDAATVIIGVLLIGLGFGVQQRPRLDRGDTRTRLEALLATWSTGSTCGSADTRPRPPGGEAVRWSSNAPRASPRTRSGKARRRAARPGRRPRAHGPVVAVDARRRRVPDHRPVGAVLASGCRALRTAPALRRVSAAARPGAGRRAAVRRPSAGDGAFGQGRVGPRRPVASFLAPFAARAGRRSPRSPWA